MNKMKGKWKKYLQYMRDRVNVFDIQKNTS